MITRFALIQAVGLGLFGVVRGFALLLCVIDIVLVGTPALLGCLTFAGRGLRTLSATVSLMFASATFVDLAGGSTEAHFHFFVMVGVVALYQDWTAFGVCILITVLHHAVMGSIAPRDVFGTASAQNKPILWALIHGAFVLAASVTHLIAWKANEDQELSDSLTRLANRTAFFEALERQLLRTQRPVSVLFVDLDNFKQINDSAGHAAGDQAIALSAERMSAVLRQGDLLARMGGDEFAVLVQGDATDAEHIAHRISDQLQAPFIAGDREFLVQASIGVADSVIAGTRDPSDLLRDADLAMYLAKASGRNQIMIYTAGVQEAVRDRADLAGDMRHALAGDQFEIHYQPVVSGPDFRVIGVEALLRWRHPVRGLLPPADFIPLAEETGDIRDIGAWVLKAAATKVAHWQNFLTGCSELDLAVNLSPVQLRDKGLLNVIHEALDVSGLAPEHLTLEVTESMLLADLEDAREQLQRIRKLGVRVAIDDFGTGYSSLSYLSRLPADLVKIDRSFVHGLTADSGRSVLIRAIIEIARGLGLDVLAEGVEEVSEQEHLNQLGCVLAQGFLYSKPLPPRDFEEFTVINADWSVAASVD